MTVAVAIAVLALFDLLLAGFRAVAGREGLITKGPLFRCGLLRAGAWACVVIAAHVALVALLDAWPAMLAAGRDAIWVFGAFASVTALSIAFWFAPKYVLRLVPTILVLGPLTLLRPLVIIGGLLWAAARSPEPRVWLVAASAGISMLAFEHLLGRRYARAWMRLVP